MVDTARMTTLRPASEVIDATLTDRVPDRERDFSPFMAGVEASPRDHGTLHAIVRRPERDRREVVNEATLDLETGLVGDDWLARGSSSQPDGRANPDSQLTIMSVRVLAAIEPDESRWALAGDQLLVDLDLSIEALPAGSRIRIGETELEISETPHTGLREVQRPVRERRPALDQLAARAGPAASGRERARGARRGRARRGHHPDGVRRRGPGRATL